MKNGLKMKFEKEKEKKEKSCRLPFSPDGPSGPSSDPHQPTSLLPLFFFPCGADIQGPRVSLPSALSFLLPLAAAPDPAPPRDPRRARPPPHLPFPSPQPIKAIKPPRDQLGPLLPILKP
jgi:hypothetical protein